MPFYENEEQKICGCDCEECPHYKGITREGGIICKVESQLRKRTHYHIADFMAHQYI